MKESVLGKLWQQAVIDQEKFDYIRRYYNIDYILSSLIASKNIPLETIENFLDPKIKNYLNPNFKLLDLEKAVDRVIDAINKKQKICVFGDYDVDGAASAALIKNIFVDLRVDIDVYIPDRFNEGYGPNNKAFSIIKEKNTKLIITVDCGTLAHEAIEFANSINMDVIVIDHHLSSDVLPKAVAVVNPNRLDETSEYKYLCGAGVAFLFCLALIRELDKQNYFDEYLAKPNLLKYLDLVALATVCDVMPLISLNRAFVSQGIKIINQRANLGISELLEVCDVFEPISCYHLGFVIGPRINAGGRVGRSFLGAQLLSTSNKGEANSIAKELEGYNLQRRDIEEKMLAEANEMALNQQDKEVIVLAKKKWHIGIIGIIAGRIKDTFEKPTVVISILDGIGKASCRSINGVNIGVKIVNAQIKGLIKAGGGHAMAAGFTILEDKISDFSIWIRKAVSQELAIANVANKTNYYDLELFPESIKLHTLDLINRLAPFGMGNKEPVFMVKDLKLMHSRIIGKRHIGVSFKSRRGRYINCICFNSVSNDVGKFLLGYKSDYITLIGYLKINYYNNNPSVQLIIKDIIV